MEVIIWFVAGAVAGYLAGVAVFEDEGVGVSGHVLVGAIAGIVGGYGATLIMGDVRPFEPELLLTVVASIVLAVFAVLLVNEYTDRERLGV